VRHPAALAPLLVLAAAAAQNPSADADRAAMMRRLGIAALRPGADADPRGRNPANTAEALAGPRDLPDPLRPPGGRAVRTAAEWLARGRPAVADVLEREVYGRVPAGLPPVRWRTVPGAENTSGRDPAGGAVEHEMEGVIAGPRPGREPVRLRMRLVLPGGGPDAGRRRAPVLVMLSPLGGPFAGGAAKKGEVLLRAGWGYALLDPISAQGDDGALLNRGIVGLGNVGRPRAPDQWGALRAWAWAASRALDALRDRPDVDPARIGVEGVSRYGKAALVAMAFDPRFAVALIGSSGKGGVTPLRRRFGEEVGNLATGQYHWMAGNFLKYDTAGVSAPGLSADDLPVDSNGLLALCAPRRVFVSYGVPAAGDAEWLDQRGSWMATVDAGRVWRLFGERGPADGPWRTKPMPAVLESRTAGALAWRQHDGGHTDAPNMAAFVAWADARLAHVPGHR